MAAMLAEIKSLVLLPQQPTVKEEDEADPCAELVHHLQEYERYKKAAYELNNLPHVKRDIFIANAVTLPITLSLSTVELSVLLKALKGVLKRAILWCTFQPVSIYLFENECRAFYQKLIKKNLSCLQLYLQKKKDECE